MRNLNDKYLSLVDSLSDGYQSVRSLSEGDRTLRPFGLSKEDLFDMLLVAVSRGHAKAYSYSSEKAEYQETHAYINDRFDKIWFYITPDGRAFVKCNWKE
jgi:hypothetical protein